MAQPYYLITAAPKKLAKIASYARKLTGKQHGDPVLAIGSHRIVLMPAAVSPCWAASVEQRKCWLKPCSPSHRLRYPRP